MAAAIPLEAPLHAIGRRRFGIAWFGIGDGSGDAFGIIHRQHTGACAAASAAPTAQNRPACQVDRCRHYRAVVIQAAGRVEADRADAVANGAGGDPMLVGTSALDGKGVGIFVAVIVGNRNGRRAQADSRGIKGHIKGGDAIHIHCTRRCAANDKIGRSVAGHGRGGDGQRANAGIANHKGTHNGAATGRYAAKVGVIAAVGGAVAIVNEKVIAVERNFGVDGAIGKDLHTMVAGIGHIDIPAAIQRHPAWPGKLTNAVAGGPPLG